MSVETFTPPPNRGVITTLVVLASLMTALDTTIANVALPHMAGSVSASPGEITWVLTSYIIASVIMTPMTGWLDARLGRKQLFLVSIIGFTAVSALCGAAQSLAEIVVFRILQGAFGAVLGPLSQAVLLDNYSLADRGKAMGIWGMGVAAAPIAGPLVGGWLTDAFSWRSVFYINLPFGVLCVIGIWMFMPGRRSAVKLPFDIMGFAFLSLMLACLQLVLDRGGEKDWFQSPEIVIEASLCLVSLILFIIHSLAVERPFVPLALFRDFNFVAAAGVGITQTVLSFSMLALLAPLAETTLGYPVLVAGWSMAPRGLGAFVSMFIVGRISGKVDDRLLILIGLGFYAFAYTLMSHYSLQMDASYLAWTGLTQGLGMAFFLIPTATMAFVTIDPKYRPDATAFYTLIRSFGASAGISIMQALWVRNVQIVHSRLVEGVTPENPLARAPYLPRGFSLTNPAGLGALNGEITRQASMVAYNDVFHLMAVICILVAPAILLLRPRSKGRASPAITEETLALE